MINLSWISSFFRCFILSLFLVNGPLGLYVNPAYFNCISGIDISLTNKNLFIISFILYVKTKEDLTKEFEGGFNSKPLNNHLASRS